jgi:DNA-binding beta-propeller fold protein YncE
MVSGDIRAVKTIFDPYPVANGIAVDPENDLVVVSDVNKKGVMMFSRSVEPSAVGVVELKRYIIGSLENQLGFVAGVALDPNTGEIFVVNNDVEDRMVVFDYEADGNAKPKRVMMVPHRAWGIAVTEDEIFITVQTFGLVVFPRDATGGRKARRNHRGEPRKLEPRGEPIRYVGLHGRRLGGSVELWREVSATFDKHLSNRCQR